MSTLISPGVSVIVQDPLPTTAVSELDVFFLTYDEPNAEENWADLCRKWPRANRVHGVKGIDAAHRACADLSDTDRFITIDGDTKVEDAFFKLNMFFAENEEDCVFSWASQNSVNGLVYGNGGLKCWTKDFVYNMNTHENAATDEKKVDFCWDTKYRQMPNDTIYAITHPNGSPLQAFRAGLREGVKLSLNEGRRVAPDKFNTLWHENVHKLAIWCTVGAHVPHGIWCIYGARMGVHLAMLRPDWDIATISDYDWFQDFWDENLANVTTKGVTTLSEHLGYELKTKLGFPIADLGIDGSKFFRAVYMPPSRKSIYR